MELWDSCSDDRFDTLAPILFSDPLGVIYVYDISSLESFEALPRWVEKLKQSVGEDEPVALVVGQKSDRVNSREVSKKQGETFAKSLQADFIETSARLNHNVAACFTLMTRRIVVLESTGNEDAIERVSYLSNFRGGSI